MSDLVDKLRSALGAETDIALAQELGVERSTVAQWRRRGSLPRIYQAILDADQVGKHRAEVIASRQQIFGDSRLMYTLRATLSVIPTSDLDYPELAPPLQGDARECVIASVARVVQAQCRVLFGRPYCENEAEYDVLADALSSEGAQSQIKIALQAPVLGVHF